MQLLRILTAAKFVLKPRKTRRTVRAPFFENFSA